MKAPEQKELDQSTDKEQLGEWSSTNYNKRGYMK